MTTRTVSALFSIALLATAYGCSSSSSSSTNALSSAATALCAFTEQCDPVGFAGDFGSTSLCAQETEQQLQATLGLPGVTESAAQFNACIRATVAQGCGGYFGMAALPSACAGVPGTLANGASCFDNSQCAGLLCNDADGTTCGTCGTLATGLADGTQCTYPNQCTSGFCGGTDVSQVCGEVVGAGATCDLTHNCGYRLTCGSAGTCVPVPSAGSACTSNNDCYLEAYDEFATCDTATSQCVITSVTYAAAGQPCDVATGSLCTPGAGCVGGACVADLLLGQSCGASGEGYCGGTTSCGPSGKCVAYGACTPPPASATRSAN